MPLAATASVVTGHGNDGPAAGAAASETAEKALGGWCQLRNGWGHTRGTDLGHEDPCPAIERGVGPTHSATLRMGRSKSTRWAEKGLSIAVRFAKRASAIRRGGESCAAVTLDLAEEP